MPQRLAFIINSITLRVIFLIYSLKATIPGHSHATSLLIGRDFRYVVAMASCFVYASNAPSLHQREPPPHHKRCKLGVTCPWQLTTFSSKPPPLLQHYYYFISYLLSHLYSFKNINICYTLKYRNFSQIEPSFPRHQTSQLFPNLMHPVDAL